MIPAGAAAAAGGAVAPPPPPPPGGAAETGMMRIRAVARAHLVLGWATALLAVLALNLQPHLQGQCTTTEDEVAHMRADALLLLLSSAAQAAAATVAAFASEDWRKGVPWSFAAFAHGMGVATFYRLDKVVFLAALVTVGSCPGSHLLVHGTPLVAHFILLAVPLGLFFLFGVDTLICALVYP
ncbi:uncharacterized protein [Aegilops tauschii subsp. strangulata]|nr:uncharacterized protein LOC120966246 [Aegilops tauschii subsp. strangulata]XP_044416406.1 uncharacterized protein LOC123141295 [Triticum aestivum]